MKSAKMGSLLLALLLTISIVFTGCGDLSSSQSSVPDSTASSTESSSSLVTTNDSSEAEQNGQDSAAQSTDSKPQQTTPSVSLANIPAFSNKPYVAVNDNTPFFSSAEFTTTSFEDYSSLDSLGRCGVAYACVGKDLMPTEERGSIGSVKPTGWHTVKYDCVDGKYLYNRCHLIGYQLSGENANTKNLITGTRYLNVDGMLPFENMVADYVKETGNHVLYRVTPIFDGNNLVASGVLMEAESIEDKGEGILFCVYCYNNQPGVSISYLDGESTSSGGAIVDDTSKVTESTQVDKVEATYVLNTNTKKFHKPDCASAKKIADKNKQTYNGSRDDLIAQGYDPCKNCNP